VILDSIVSSTWVNQLDEVQFWSLPHSKKQDDDLKCGEVMDTTDVVSVHHVRTSRLGFIDNVRIFLTILVIAHHAGQAYGPTGGRWLIFNPERADILGTFFGVNAAFFMGLFFLISGYFTPGPYSRKGGKAFLKDRFLRLGIPIVFFALLVFPLVLYCIEPGELSFGQFLFQVYFSQGQLELGHLWFLLHLLVYAVCYALWCEVINSKTQTRSEKLAVPSHPVILIYLVNLAVVSFVVRIWYPIDTWKPLLGIIPTEIAHFPQYLSLFLIGILMYHHDWLQRLPLRRGLIWLGIGIGAVVLRYGYDLAGYKLFPTRIIAGSGLDWRSLVWSTWEATICVGLCVGLLISFRKWGNRQGLLLQWLSANAYTVYLVHLLVVLLLQFTFAPIEISPLLKFVLVTLIGVPLCFLLSECIRKLPFTRAIL